MAYTNILLFRFDGFGNIIYQSPNTLNPGSTGQGLLRVQVPFDNTTYTGDITWSLANDQSVAQTFDTVAQVTVDDTVYYQWDKPIDDTINVVSANNSSVDLKFTARFTSSNQALTMEQGLIPVTAGDTTGLSPIAPDEAADLAADKRDRNPSALTAIDFDNVTKITGYDTETLGEKATTLDELKEWINEDSAKVRLLPTNTDSDIDDDNLGVKFKKNVNNTTESGYNSTVTEITLSTTVAGTFENVYSFIAPVGFLNGLRENIDFSTTLQAKKKTGNVGNVDFKLQYLKWNNDIETEIFTGLPITISTDDYNVSTKSGTITSTELDADSGDRWITRLFIKSSTIGDGVSFQVGGTNPVSFTSFNVDTSTVNENKIDKLFGAVGGKLVESKTDGELLESTIDLTDVALKSDKGVADGYASLDSGGKVPASQLPIDIVNLKGSFGNGASTTGGDVPASADVGDTYYCLVNEYVSVNASDTFYINDKALYTLDGWIRNAANDSVLSVAGRTGEVVLTKADVGLTNVDNTTDLLKPISTATQTALDDKLTYVGMFVDGVAVGANQFKKINITSGGSITQDGTDPTQANWDIFGAGTGEGTIVLGQATTVVPFVAPVTETLFNWDTQVDGQSTDLTVMELFDKDLAPANTFRVYKTKTELLDEPVQYKFFLQGQAVNTNTGTSVNLTYTLKKGGVIQWTKLATIAEATPQANGSNNFIIEEYVTTDPLETSEDLQLFITASATGVTLNKLEIHFTSNFVSGEALSNLMRTDTYDTGKLGRVDKANADASGNVITTTYATKSNVLELDNTTEFTPDSDYEPATKKYVDDNAGGSSGIGNNAIINSNFSINQRAVSGTVVLTSGEYGHDRFRAGSSGCTYTFATSNNITTITITAGTLQQEIEGINLESGSYVLSWLGTATAQIDAGGFGTSGVIKTLIGGTNSIVEFSTGTVSKVKLEKGTTPTEFVIRDISEELKLCQRYYEVLDAITGSDYLGVGVAITTTLAIQVLSIENKRTSTPTLTFNGTFRLRGSSFKTVSNIALNTLVGKIMGLLITSTGLTAGNGYLFQFDADTSSKIEIDDEL